MTSSLPALLGTRSVGEFADGLADALGWPRSRPARMMVGTRATMIDRAAVCSSEEAIGGVEAPATTVCLLAQSPSPAFARSGRRSYDIYVGDDDVAEWMRAERPIIDASEMLSGGMGGIEQLLAERCGATVSGPLIPVDRDELKFVGFVPEAELPAVRDAVFAAGAGTIGAYTECSWSTAGTGTFRGSATTKPSVGRAGAFEEAAEVRFETVVPHHKVAAVSRAFVTAHSYEEPAFDVYALRTPSKVGRGRVAVMPCTASAIAKVLASSDIHVAGEHITTPRNSLIVTTESLSTVLPALLEHDDSAVVVCASAREIEQALLAGRNMDVLTVDPALVVQACGDKLAATLARTIGMRVEIVNALTFPGASRGADIPTPAPDAQRSVPQDTEALLSVSGTSTGRWSLNFDGGSRGNPGPAAYGFVLVAPDGTEAARIGEVLGSTTNNVAEYTGLVRGLEYARSLGVTQIDIRGDSELIVKQVLGQYRVKNEQLKPLFEDVKRLLSEFDEHSIRHVYRSDNSIADSLVNKALDAQ